MKCNTNTYIGCDTFCHQFQENSGSEEEAENSETVISDDDSAEMSMDADMVDQDIEERDANRAQVRT